MRTIGRVLILGCALFGSARLAIPCSCGHLASSAESFAASTQVFEGQASDLDPVWGRGLVFPEKLPLHQWSFRVLNVWKGSASSTVSVVSTGGNCSFTFSRGGRYVVFGQPHPTVAGVLETSICTATRGVQEESVRDPALGRATQVQQLGRLAPESLIHRSSRVLRGSIYTGWALLAHSWREWSETDSLAAVLVRYGGGLAAIAAVYLLVLASVRGHLKLVVASVTAIGLVSLLGLVAWGFACATRNPIFKDLVALGAFYDAPAVKPSDGN